MRPALFEGQVEATPDALAVVFDDERCQLQRAERPRQSAGASLIELGVGPDALVGIALERSLAMIVALLGMLKAGGAYVPLDPDYPAERLAFMLEDSRCARAADAGALRERLPHTLRRRLCLDSERHASAASRGPTRNARSRRINSRYVIYTSGSTGRPREWRSSIAARPL